MGKVITMTAIVMGTIAILALMGVAGTNTSKLIQSLGLTDITDTSTDLGSGQWYSLLFGVAGAITAFGAVAGIIIGFISGGRLVEAVLGAFVGTLTGWVIADLNTIRVQLLASMPLEFIYISYLLNIMLVMFAGIFILSMIEFWRGSD